MIRNLRDLSIYQNKSGKHLKKDVFIRSAALVNLKRNDIHFLEKYETLTVIDLRTGNERNEKPDYKIGTYHAITLMDDLPSGVAHDRKSKEEIVKKVPNMPELYAGFIKSDLGLNGIEKAFKIITDPDRKGTVLWHCTEGKDRCGIVSALFLKLMDFDDETIYADYLKSAKSSKKRADKYYWIVRILLKNKTGAEAIRLAFSAKKEFLDAAFKAIEEKFGGFDEFFASMGIDAEKKRELQDRFLE